MKEKIRKKTKRPQTEDMIFTEEDFEDVSEETKEKRGSSQEESSECWCFYILEFLYFL